MSILLRFLIAMLASLAFSILFAAPRRQWIFCSLVGGVGWLVNFILLELKIDPFLSCFCAAFALTVLCRLFSLCRKCPITVFLVAGIFPLVPGSGVYYTASYLFSNNFSMGTAKGIETLKYSGVIALGILFGLSLPALLFRWAGGRAVRKKKK